MNLIKIALFLAMGAIFYSLVLEVLTYRDSPEYRIKSRLNSITALKDANELISLDKNKKDSLINKIKINESFDKRLSASGMKIMPQEFVAMWAAATVLPALFWVVVNGLSLLSLVFVAVGFICPLAYLQQCEKQRKVKFGNQLNDALIIIGNSLRSGFTFKNAMTQVARDMPDPIAIEFRRVSREVNYGRSLEDALGDLADRMDSKELGLINSAVSIQQKSGGNLAEIIDKVSETINQRIKMKNKVKALSAQGKMSGAVIGLLPVFLFVVISFINPEYMEYFTTETMGKYALVFSVAWEVIGMMLINKIVDVEV